MSDWSCLDQGSIPPQERRACAAFRRCHCARVSRAGVMLSEAPSTVSEALSHFYGMILGGFVYLFVWRIFQSPFPTCSTCYIYEWLSVGYYCN